ncbi:MAG: hypothetical protein KBC33_03740 [Candidatus Pacebacteria bacterium]|nr:hypothetical protein [Candidatus Paceibacterota bacterium]
MSLNSTLDNLRAKPEHVRTRIAFWSSLGLTVVIFTFWAASFSVTGTPTKAVAAAVEKAGTPGQSLLANVGSFFVDIKEMIFGSKKIQYAEVEVRAGEK